MSTPRNSPLDQARDAFEAGDFARARVLAEEAVRASDTVTERAADSAHPRSEESSRAEARRLLALALHYVDQGEEAEPLAREAIRTRKSQAIVTVAASSTSAPIPST